jgi:hypothetical protein
VKDKVTFPEKDDVDVIVKDAMEFPIVKFAGGEAVGFEVLLISSTVVKPLADTVAKFKSTPTFLLAEGTADTETLEPDGVETLYV